MDRSVWVLLIEGRRTVHTKIKRQLEGTNFELVTAAGKNSAIEKISRQPFNLIMIGSEIEKADSLSLISSTQALTSPPAVLIFVRRGQEMVAADCLSAGASDYIIQDRDDQYLILLPRVINNILSRRQLELERLSMLTTLKQRNLVLTSLNQIGRELTSILESNRLIKRLMRSAIEILNAEGGSLWLWSNDHPDTLVCHAVLHRANTPPLVGVECKASDGVVGWVATTNQSTILDRVDMDARFTQEIDRRINFQTRMILAVPLRFRDKAIGVLEFVNKISGRFNEDDIVIAETLGASATTALENARLIDQLRLHTNDLEERNEELNAFAYTLAHDLQNILSRIGGFSEILESEFASDTETMSRDQMIQASRLISRNSRKMSGIIDALLLFSSVREAEISFSTIEMKGIVIEVIERLKEQIKETQASITLPDSWPLSMGYGPWAEEIWYNFLSNALKYGGSPPIIELGAESNPMMKEVRFWIQDNGEGVNPDFVHHLFQPFKQSNQRDQEGYGLGLSIVARIVQRMNGEVGYRKREEGGSCFYFTLPIH